MLDAESIAMTQGAEVCRAAVRRLSESLRAHRSTYHRCSHRSAVRLAMLSLLPELRELSEVVTGFIEAVEGEGF